LKEYDGFLTTVLFTTDKKENVDSVHGIHITILYIYIEKKCDYHQNQVRNQTIPTEQTLVGRISFITILIRFY
jgi:hypothetical protein